VKAIVLHFTCYTKWIATIDLSCSLSSIADILLNELPFHLYVLLYLTFHVPFAMPPNPIIAGTSILRKNKAHGFPLKIKHIAFPTYALHGL